MPRAALSDAVVEPLMLEFDEVFREHADLVFGTACEVTGKKEDGEDVVQTVFLRLLRRGLPPDFQRNPKSYLYRAPVNESQNIIRSRRRPPTQTLEEVETPAAPDDTDSHEIIH